VRAIRLHMNGRYAYERAPLDTRFIAHVLGGRYPRVQHDRHMVACAVDTLLRPACALDRQGNPRRLRRLGHRRKTGEESKHSEQLAQHYAAK